MRTHRTQLKLITSLLIIGCLLSGTAQLSDPSPARAAGFGATWISRTSGTANDLFDVSCLSPRACVAVGRAGAILTTADGGATWTSRTSGTGNDLSGVNCPGPRACVAVGWDGTILISADGGATWTSRTSGTSWPLQSVSCPSTSACVAVGQHIIVTSTDGGNGWTIRASGIDDGLNQVSCPSRSVCVAVGQVFGSYDGIIVGSRDGGATWTSRTSVPGIPMEGVSCPSPRACMAMGAADSQAPADPAGAILISADGGATWTNRTAGASSSRSDVSCPSTSACVAVGGTEAIVTTADGGATWTSRTSGTGNALTRVSCPNTSVCVAVGYGGTILTSDAVPFRTPQGRLALVLPGPNAILTGTNLPFAWRPYTKGAYYALQLWLVDPMQGEVMRARVITILTRRLSGTSYRLNIATMPPGVYHWRMAATDAGGTLISPWTREFTATLATGASLTPVAAATHRDQLHTTLPGPNTLLTGPVLPFAWSPYHAVVMYNLQLWLVRSATAAPLAPSSKTLFSARLSGTRYLLPVSSFARGVYHWRMAATDKTGAIISPWTPEQNVTIPSTAS